MEKPIDKVELRILFAVRSLRGKARHGKIYKEVGGRALAKDTFQNRLKALQEKHMLKHKKTRSGPLGESWYSLTAKARRTLAEMPSNPWRTQLDGLEGYLKRKDVAAKDKSAAIERAVKDFPKAALSLACKLMVKAGLEDDLVRRESLKIFVIEDIFSDLVNCLIDLLHEHKDLASEELKKLARPV